MNPCDNVEALLRTLTAPRRNAYFYGKRMDVQHFQLEQDYGKHKQWLLNRLTLGKGVVCGLKVSIEGEHLCVDPGFAIDGLGREIVVPVRQCIDPTTQDGGCCAPCCDGGDVATPPTRPDPDRPQPDARNGIFTLWLCYKECKTDFQPVMTSECGTREACAAGTTVETFCLKVTAAIAPLQGDPAWCAQLWGKEEPDEPTDADDPTQPPAPPTGPRLRAGPGNMMALRQQLAGGTLSHAAGLPSADELKAALASKRRVLCELLGDDCALDEGDACVPLGLFIRRDGRILDFDACLVRPHVYSNAVLLDLILCLAEKIDECCHHGDTPNPPTPTSMLKVRSVEFLGGPNLDVIATVNSPLADTAVPINRQSTAIRIVFSAPLSTDPAHAPRTGELNDADWKRGNVLVTPESGILGGLDYVPGSVSLVAPDTLLWTLSKESPYYVTRYKGWQKGRRRLTLHGVADPAIPRVALADSSGSALDGEPIAPAGGVMSGNDQPGGEFTLLFTVG
jgi:hypothetical protein